MALPPMQFNVAPRPQSPIVDAFFQYILQPFIMKREVAQREQLQAATERGTELGEIQTGQAVPLKPDDYGLAGQAGIAPKYSCFKLPGMGNPTDYYDPK